MMSSSGVHGPFLTPILSQHGDRPMERERGEFRLSASCCLSRDEAFLAAYIEGEGVDFC